MVTLLVSEQQISEWFKLPYNRAYPFELSINISSYYAKILRTLSTIMDLCKHMINVTYASITHTCNSKLKIIDGCTPRDIYTCTWLSQTHLNRFTISSRQPDTIRSFRAWIFLLRYERSAFRLKWLGLKTNGNK